MFHGFAVNKYWINQGAPNKDFWAHEVGFVRLPVKYMLTPSPSQFSKHATCTSTFDVACFPNYKKHEDVINFFDAVIRAFSKFPTFQFLATYVTACFTTVLLLLIDMFRAGITPSNTTTYTLAQLQNAVKAQTGAIPYFGCSGSQHNILDEVWHFNHVLGTEQYGHFKPIDSTTKSSCNATGIRYLERTPSSEREVRILP